MCFYGLVCPPKVLWSPWEEHAPGNHWAIECDIWSTVESDQKHEAKPRQPLAWSRAVPLTCKQEKYCCKSLKFGVVWGRGNSLLIQLVTRWLFETVQGEISAGGDIYANFWMIRWGQCYIEINKMITAGRALFSYCQEPKERLGLTCKKETQSPFN